MKKIKDQINDVLNEGEKAIQISQKDIDKVELLLDQAANILEKIVAEHGENSKFGNLIQNKTIPMLKDLIQDADGQGMDQPTGSIMSLQALVHKSIKKFR
jgi:hypothetical protein